MEVNDTLGNFDPIWDVWSSVQDRIRALPQDHFPRTLVAQLDEIEALQAQPGGEDAIEKELIDIISVTFNWLRYRGLSRREVGRLARMRAWTRYLHQTDAIIDKYERLFAEERHGHIVN